MVQKMRAGVVGGSISGCAAAVMMRRLGHEVALFERSKNGLLSRGAGIATRPAVLHALAEHELIGRRFPSIPMTTDRWVGRRAGAEPAGHLAGSFTYRSPMVALNWGDLFDDLRRRVPDGIYRLGAEVEAIHSEPGSGSVLRLGDGSEHDFDLIVFADGYRSLGRATLFPQSELQYRGYVLWRGLVPQPGLPLLDEGVSRVGYHGGYGVFYDVPAGGSASLTGRRCVNWGLYLQVPAAELGGFLLDREGRVGEGSVASGMLPPGREADLKRWATLNLPARYAEILNRSQNTFVQAIYSTRVPSYFQGRTALLGDAGSLFPPFTASGVFKAMSNAIDLGVSLGGTGTLDEALAAWNRRQLAHAAATEGPAEAMERAWIFSMPDVGSMDSDAYRAWTRGFLNEFSADANAATPPPAS